MANPQVIGPDGVAREQTIFSTTSPTRFFQGIMDASTVDMQISIRGSAFTSDPDFIVFEGTSFSFPNPTAFPEGLELIPGLNEIQIRSVSFSGSVSDTSVVQVTLVQESDIGLIGTPPTNISVERSDETITVRAQGIDDSRFQGMNFYASRFPGGGASGYQRINLDTVTDFEPQEETTTLQDFEANSEVVLNPDGSPAADPLYLKIQEVQSSSPDVIENLEDINLTPELAQAITEQEQASLIKTDFTQVFEVPETVRNIRTSVTVESVTEVEIYSFTHNRQFGPGNDPPTIPIAEFANVPLEEPLYYVVTALFFDETLQLEVESAFSIEVYAAPTTVNLILGTFPSPSRRGIVRDLSASLLRVQPQVAIQPGAVTRDTFIDPGSNELIRVRFLADFLHRIQSFDTLIPIDGVESDGSSTPVNRSAYKQALQGVFGLQRPDDVQVIVDSAFEQLASRNGIFRRPGIRSRGIVTFYTRTTPQQTFFIPLGTIVSSGNVNFLTTADASIPLSSIASFFNPSTGLYSIDVPVQAEDVGEVGDVAPGQINTIVSSIPGLSVTNQNRTFGGKERETNVRLSARARIALSAVDSGTAQGTVQDAADVAGVLEATVVAAGDPLMQRDFDSDAQRHVGGKVDVWIRGEVIGRVTDNFALTFEIANDVQFVIIGNPQNYIFRALDVNLSTENPIAEMLDFPEAGLGFRNATTGQSFDLTDVQVLDYQTIQLSTDVVQPQITLGQVFLGDYRYVSSRKFVFTRQPVRSVVSVTGQVSGLLPEENYKFVRPSDPLLDGRSTRAGDYLEIIQIDDFPASSFIAVTSEQHILLGEFDEFVFNVGANPLTVQVFNQTRTVEFRGPLDPSGISDYTIVPGDQTTALSIRRTTNSTIQSGETVLVDYSHAENFTVSYEINLVSQTTQAAVDETKHATADVLVKESVPVPVDISATIATIQGTRVSTVDQRLRTNLTSFLRAFPQGSAIRQSDLIAVIDNTTGVSFVQTPLTKVARSEGARVVRESIQTALGSDVVLLQGNTLVPYSNDENRVWLIKDELQSATSNGGGDDTNFRGVFQDDVELELQISDPVSLQDSPGKAFIIGQDGFSIPGYSDDETIQNEYPTALTSQDFENIRKELTANRVMVSLEVADRPQLHNYTVTYTVAFVASGSQDLEASDLEFFENGEFTFTFTEDPRG